MTTPDRPTSDALRRERRRPPTPAPDEATDPVDYHPSPAPRATSSPAAAPAPVQVESLARRRGRDRGLPFSTRLDPDVIDSLEAVVATGQQPTLRAALEHAIRNVYGAPSEG